MGTNKNGDYKAVVRLLLAKGANVNAKDKSDGTPLSTAVFWNATDIADILRAAGGTE